MSRIKTPTGKGRARQLATANRGRLIPGEVVNGVITDYDAARQLYTVNVKGQPVTGVIAANGLFSALIGFKTSMRMAVGTQVVIVYGYPSWIVAATSEDTPDQASYNSAVMTGTGMKDMLDPAGDTSYVPGSPSSSELYQGEFEISNMIGTFIRFLTFMASIGSGERAKIECHLLRDMVRIVSRNFEHFSSSGDFKIMDDGRLSMEMNGTTYTHERWGNLNPNDPKFSGDGTEMPEDIDPKDTGRWRYSMLVGFMGDLLNSWFTDPVKSVGKMAEDAFRSGKARVHVGQDGTILMQSCADIVLERVCRVQVPIRIKHEEDPEGVLKDEMNKLDKSFLKLWRWQEVDEHHRLFQLREYVRYLNQYQSLARLHQLEKAKGKDWKIPTEDETPKPEAGAGEKDRTEANSGNTFWKDCYATIRIYRDGSTLTLDAYGNATASGPYGIQLSSTRHIQLFAAADIILKAGGSLYASAKRHVEVVASRGALLLKARTGWRALCEKATMWLKSDFDPENPYSPEDGDPEPEVVEEQGIRIQATKAETRWLSEKKARFIVKKKDEDLEIKTSGKMLIDVKKDLELNVKEKMLTVVKDIWAASAKMLTSRFRKGFAIENVCHLKNGISKLNRFDTLGMRSHGAIAGPKFIGKPLEGRAPYRQHENHIVVYEPEEDLSLDLEEVIPDPLPVDEEPGGNLWKMVKQDEYKWDNPGYAAPKNDFDFEPPAQQTLRLDSEKSSAYDEWSKMTDKLLSAPETAPDTPWPGDDYKWKIHNPSKPLLREPSSEPASSYGSESETPLTAQTPQFKVLRK